MSGTTSTTAARHGEIAMRYGAIKPNRRRFSVTALRIAELNRIFRTRYGYVLPDDDAGRDDAFLMCCHIAHCQDDPSRRMRLWQGLWAPWMGGVRQS